MCDREGGKGHNEAGREAACVDGTNNQAQPVCVVPRNRKSLLAWLLTALLTSPTTCVITLSLSHLKRVESPFKCQREEAKT